MAETDTSRVGTVGDGSRRGTATSIKATWSTGAVNGGAEERGASAGEKCLQATGADVSAEIETDLSQLPNEGKKYGAIKGWKAH